MKLFYFHYAFQRNDFYSCRRQFGIVGVALLFSSVVYVFVEFRTQTYFTWYSILNLEVSLKVTIILLEGVDAET